jgi:hypothetical protein
MRRRTFLATAGTGLAGAVGLAGCLNVGDGGSGDGTPTGDDGPTATPTDAPTTTTDRGPTTTESPPTDEPTTTTGESGTADVTVRSLHLQYGLVTPSSPDSIGTWNTDTPYLMALVAVDGNLPRSEFTLNIGGERIGPTEQTRLYRTAWGDYEWYARGRPGGVLAFELPTGNPDGTMTLTWPGGERSIDEDVGSRLAVGPPQFSATLDLPETHDNLDAPPVEIEVTNGDDVPRRFLGALNRVGPMVAYIPVTRVSEMVSPGETVTLTVEDDWSGMPGEERIGDGDPDVTYRLHYADGEAVGDIRIVESE